MTYEEEAKWWDTHDLSGVWDQMEDVELTVEPGAFDAPKKPKKLSSVVNVRLDPKDYNKLRVVSDKIGLGATTLARVWILEKLMKIEPNGVVREAK